MPIVILVSSYVPLHEHWGTAYWDNKCVERKVRINVCQHEQWPEREDENISAQVGQNIQHPRLMPDVHTSAVENYIISAQHKIAVRQRSGQLRPPAQQYLLLHQ